MSLSLPRSRRLLWLAAFGFASACVLLLAIVNAVYAVPIGGVSIDATASATPADGSVTINVALAGPLAGTVTAQYTTVDGTATAPADYTAQSGTVIFAPGVPDQQITIAITNPGTGAPNKTFTVQLSNVSSPGWLVNSTCTVTIVETPPPTVQFSKAKYHVKESKPSKKITVTLSAASTGTVTVNYATSDGTGKHPAIAGTDYTATSGQLTFNPTDPTPANTTQTFEVPILNTGKPGPNRSLNLTLSSPSGAILGTPNPAVLTIVDDNPPLPKVEIEFAVPSYNYVFMTPSNVTNTIYTPAYARSLTLGADLSVELTTKPGGGVFNFSSATGNENSTAITLTLPGDGSLVPFRVSGNAASASMGDAKIVAYVFAQKAGQKKGSVAKVDISFLYKPSNEPKKGAGGVVTGEDNSARNEYKKIRKDNSYKLGQGEYANGGWGWGVLTIGTIEPTDFDKEIILQRNTQDRGYKKHIPGPADWLGAAKDFPTPHDSTPGNDTGKGPGEDSITHQDRKPQSGGSKGHVYDWDMPGFAINIENSLAGDVKSQRANFFAFATALDSTGATTRVSDMYKWSVRQSYLCEERKDKTLAWVQYKKIKGDNELNVGKDSFTLLSYELGSPKITSADPSTLSKASYKVLKPQIKLKGENFVEKPTVVLKKAGSPDAKLHPKGFTNGDREVKLELVGPLADLANGEWTLEWTNPADNTVATTKITVDD